MTPDSEFLTVDECHQVDAALLTSREKFTARVSIYALRSLKAIAQDQQCAIQDLKPATIVAWINADPSLQAGQDEHFREFFAQIVLGARKPLRLVAEDLGCAIEVLTVADVIAWHEAQSKEHLTIPE